MKMPSDDRQAESSPGVKENEVRILVVEDNQMNQRLAGFMLKNRGYLYDVSSSGEDALLKLKNTSYDLVLMDIEMPGMNGYECTQKIRKELNMTLPVIAMTAHDTESEKEKCRASGMNGYVAKPIDENEFDKVTRSFLGPKAQN